MLKTVEQFTVGTIGVLSPDLLKCLEEADRRKQGEAIAAGREWKPDPRQEELRQLVLTRQQMRIAKEGFNAGGNGAGEPYVRVEPRGRPMRHPYAVKAKHFIPNS